MSKIDELLQVGDAYLMAKRTVRDFLCEMKHDLPEMDSHDGTGVWYYQSPDIETWIKKWFGESGIK